MKRLILVLMALFLIAGGTGLAAGAPADEFSVLSFSPSGTVKGRAPVKIVFSQPAAPKNLIGKAIPADRHPVSFSPSIRGRQMGRCQDLRLHPPGEPSLRHTLQGHPQG